MRNDVNNVSVFESLRFRHTNTRVRFLVYTMDTILKCKPCVSDENDERFRPL